MGALPWQEKSSMVDTICVYGIIHSIKLSPAHKARLVDRRRIFQVTLKNFVKKSLCRNRQLCAVKPSASAALT